MKRITKTLAIVGAAVSLALAGANAAAARPGAAPAGAAPQAATGIVNTSAGARSTAAYWTAARRAAATPEPAPVASAKTEAAAPVADRLPAISKAPTAPARTGAHPNGTAKLLAGSVAALWSPHGTMPALTTGKIYFTRTDGSNGYCTGSVITAANLNTVWTAGHCINAGNGGGYFSNFSFVPDTDNGSTPWGTWSWKYANTTIGWQNSGDLHYDVAAIAFYPQSTHGNLQSFLGAQGYRFGYGQSFSVTDFGYPQDGYNRTDFPANGSKMYYCTGQTYRKSSSDDLMGLSCDMHHGASGGPWLTDLASWGGGYIVGAYSHRTVNSSGVPTDIEARSANHGDGAINVYNDVSNR
jgi:V8-like Glu-specific endopeptidase